MNKSPYITNKSTEVKARLKFAIDKYNIDEFILAEKLGTKPASVRVALRKINRLDLNYQPPNILKLHKALDELHIPREDTEVFDGIMQGLKGCKDFMQGKDNGTTIYNKEGKELKGQEAVDYYQALKKSKE